ncbi:MAG: hypothetical protein HY319_24215 [Armatimonadetes bacterium]|nr:hypothetical protein [Armatimonadota bacterium]
MCEGSTVRREVELRSIDKPMGAYRLCPEKIVHYVRRTHEDVVLADAGAAVG